MDLGYDLEEALEREGISKIDLISLRDPPIDGVPTNVTDKQLAFFMGACGSISEARKVLKLYYAHRKSTPEHFSNRDPLSETIQQCLEAQDYFHLPPTPEGYEVVFHRLSSPKASHYHFDHAIKTFLMTIDSCIYDYGPRRGVIFLFDMKSVGLMHLTRVRIGSIRNFFFYLQECLPAQLKAIHIFNVVGFFDKILALIKPFMKAEIIQMMHLHPSSIDYDKFSDEFKIPKSSLPADYGGDLPTVKELHQDYIGQLESKRKYFLAEEKMRRDFDLNEKFGFDSEEKEINVQLV